MVRSGSIDERIGRTVWRLLKPDDSMNALKALLYASAFAITVVGVGYCNRLVGLGEQKKLEAITTITEKYGNSMRPEELRDYLRSLNLVQNQ